jgi:hypothetical protein
MTEKAKLSPFDILSILNEKKEVLDQEDIQTFYSPWMINKGFSQMRDTVLFANEMNRLSSLPRDLQFDFYYYGISRKKRYGKWNKMVEEQDISLAMERYPHFSKKRLREVMSILRPHVKSIEGELYKGGAQKKRK